MGFPFEIVFTNGAPTEQACQSEYTSRQLRSPYALQSLIAEGVVDVACTCYCAIGTCIHTLPRVCVRVCGVCVRACVRACVCVCDH